MTVYQIPVEIPEYNPDHVYAVGDKVLYSFIRVDEFDAVGEVVKSYGNGIYEIKFLGGEAKNIPQISKGEDDLRPYISVSPEAVEQKEIPALQGSTAQVKWAQDIRDEAIKQCDEMVSSMRTNGNPADWIDFVKSAILEVLYSGEKLVASWWIDRRVGAPIQVGKPQPAGGNWEMVIQSELQAKLGAEHRRRQLEVRRGRR